MRLGFVSLFVASVWMMGCGNSSVNPVNAAETERKKEISIQHLKQQKQDAVAASLPNQNKAGKLETKVMPRGATEVVATVKPEDLDKALACLATVKIEAKTSKEGDFIDVIVATGDTNRAAMELNADAEIKGYEIHAKKSSAIKPDVKKP